MGVLRWQLHLDRIIQHYANRNLDTVDPAVRISVRLGLYQLRFLSRIPPSAAVNESVKLVGHARLRSAQSFVNAVLRRATREPEYNPAAAIVDPLERMAIETSHPAWLLSRWCKAFGNETARAIAEADNATPGISFRVVNSRSSESNVLLKLRNAGATLDASVITPGAWRVTNAGAVVRMLAAGGEIYLQDEGSQLVPRVVDARANERILDLCAAPGGKTTQIADLVGDQALIVAGDLSARRLRMVGKTSSLHHLHSIKLLVVDAEHPLPFLEGAFDRVLVDAPCTGTGTLAHNPEIRWRIGAEDIQRLSAKQRRILRNAATSVRSGGRLVYSTCSLELEENEQVVRDFLESDPAFRLLRIELNPSIQTEAGLIRVWPQLHGTGGFFVAAFERDSRH